MGTAHPDSGCYLILRKRPHLSQRRAWQPCLHTFTIIGTKGIMATAKMLPPNSEHVRKTAKPRDIAAVNAQHFLFPKRRRLIMQAMSTTWMMATVQQRRQECRRSNLRIIQKD